MLNLEVPQFNSGTISLVPISFIKVAMRKEKLLIGCTKSQTTKLLDFTDIIDCWKILRQDLSFSDHNYTQKSLKMNYGVAENNE